MKIIQITFLFLILGLVMFTACADTSVDEQTYPETTLSQEELDELFESGADTGLNDDEDFVELGEMI